MNGIRQIALAAMILLGFLWQSAYASDSCLVEGFFVNPTTPWHQDGNPTPDTNPLSFSSGGNHPVAEDDQGNPVVISIGYPVAATAGFPGATTALKNKAQEKIDEGAVYRYDPATGQTGIGTGAWDIRFPDVRDQMTGDLWEESPGNEQNYFEDKILEAERLYRGALSVDPFDTVACESLLRCYYERMVPKTFAGNNSLVWGTRCRYSDKTLSEEIAILEEALAFYQEAVDIFIEATGLLPDIDYLNGTDPHVDHAILRDSDPLDPGIVPLLVEAYIQALALKGEALEKIVHQTYKRDYTDPVLPIDMDVNRLAILNRIDQEVSQMRHQLLLASSFSDLAFYEESDIVRAENAVSSLEVMRTAVRDGHQFFAVSRGASGTVNGDSFGVYPPEYVPFIFDPFQFSGYTNTFDLLHAGAVDSVTLAATMETSAQGSTRDYDNNQQELEDRFEEIRTTYESEMTTLCGQRIFADGFLHPDISQAMLPPGEREQYDDYTGPGETKGAVFQQWLKVQYSETAYDAAIKDLENLEAKLQKHQDTADAIVGTINNLAQIILENGEKIAALELRAGELKAYQIKYSQRKKSQAGLWKSALGFAGTFDPDEEFSLDLETACGYASKYVKSKATADIAKNDEYTARELGKIAAQKARIRAMESAQVQYQRRDELLLKTEEDVYGMMLDAERLKLNILMSQQKLDMETGELGNMFGRVAYLLQEYGRAINVTVDSTLARPDFRLIRNLTMREADDMFLVAQERCYLTAKAAEYRVNSMSGVTDIGNRIEAVLNARKTSDLQTILVNLNNDIQNLYMTQGTQVGVDQRRISVRDFLVQNNSLVRNADGTVVPDPGNMEQQFRDANGDIITSDEHWEDFLEECLVYDTVLDDYKLVIPFATSLNRAKRPAPINAGSDPLDGHERDNPLFDTQMIGMLIVWDEVPTSGRRGVLVDVQGSALNITGTDYMRMDLRQDGASYVRFTKWCNDTNGTGVRTWNLQPVLGRITPSINGTVVQVDQTGQYSPSCPQYHERSPANDHWTLTIEPVGTANNQLLNQLDSITDIVITFCVTGFTPSEICY